jgi:tetratricopeptide (TPR) repeat protein
MRLGFRVSTGRFPSVRNLLTACALAASCAACSKPPKASSAAATGAASSPPATTVDQVVRATRPGKPVIFVGLDGADWQLLDQYMARGLMPNLKGLVADGTAGTLGTLLPPLSPIVWTTMMTGVDPLKHRILDFVRLNPASGQKEPITSDERKAPAIWNMESWAGRRVGVFGLWATYPAEPVNGVMVSDRLFTFLFKELQPPEGVVAPRSEEAWARAVVDRVDRETNLAELKKYLPSLDAHQYESLAASADPYAQPVSALRRILIETRIYDELARDWIGRTKPDLALVYIQGTDSIGHTFAPYAPPRQPSIAAADYERYHGVPERYFAEIDQLLGRYRELAASRGAVLVLASDHGFAWGDDRPEQLSSNAQATAAKWHRKQGIYLLWGPGVPARGRDPKADGAVAQLCATLLAFTGLPPLKGDAAGPLAGAPSATSEPVDYAALYHPAAAPTGSTKQVDADSLQKLRSLGYIGGAESSGGQRTIEVTRSAGSYNNEGIVLKAQGRKPEAIHAFENALIIDPNLASALWNLSDLLFLDPASLDRSDKLLAQAYGAGLPQGTKFLVGRAIGYQRAGQVNRSIALLRAGVALKAEQPDPWFFLGRYEVESGDCARAVADLQHLTELSPQDPKAFASLGLARLCAGDRAAAKRDLQRSLQLDPRQPPVREYLRTLGG